MNHQYNSMQIKFPKLTRYLALCFALFFGGNATAVSREQAELLDLEAEIQSSEAKISNVVIGAEKTIRWHGNAGQKTPISLIYLHGFSASRQELNPLIERLGDNLGANIFYTRLRGHGRDAQAMLDGSIDAWHEDTLEAYKIAQQIGDHVVVIGTSTGATLATWLNTQNIAQNNLATIMVSPNFGVKNGSAWMMKWSLGLWIAKKISGGYHSFEPQNEFHAQVWTERYPLDALVPMLNLVDQVVALDKSKISNPQMIVYSPEDKVVDVDATLSMVKDFTSTSVKLEPFTESKDPGQHVLVGKASAMDGLEELVAKMQEFVSARLAETMAKSGR